VVDDERVLIIVEVGAEEEPRILEQPLHLLGAVLGEDDRALLLVLVVILGVEALHDLVDRDVELGLVVRGAGDDQRRARLVDEDRVDLVDDGEVEGPLDHRLALVLHIVAQIVEAELVVRAVGDVAVVGVAALLVAEIGDDDADRHAEKAVDLTHPVGIAASEVVVHRDDMDALAFQRVQIGCERGDEGLALAGAHLGDLAAVEDDAADQLDVVMALPQRALGGLADRGEGFGDEVVERLALRQPLAEHYGLVPQLLVGHRRDARLEAVHPVDDLAERADVAVVGRPENGFGKSAEHVEFLS
jgi:hypothetical protein